MLIDPPYESQDAEFRVIEKSLKAAMEKCHMGGHHHKMGDKKMDEKKS